MATAIGVISGLLTIFTFADTYFGGQEDAESTIRIAVAVDGNGGTDNGGGDLPDTRLFNIYGDFLGMTADPGSVADGEVGELTVTHEDDSAQQAPYTLFSANDDAICIAYATITWPAPSSEKYWFDGTYGSACGFSWFYSGIYMQESNYRPNCFWIDANGDQPQTGFQVRWPTFADEGLEGGNATQLCQSIDFNVYEEEDPSSIIFDPNPNEKRSAYPAHGRRTARPDSFEDRQLRARSLQERRKLGSSLVVDDAIQNGARALCESESSAGPDFVNEAEGIYCDMDEKTVYAVCGSSHHTNKDSSCFDMDVMALNGRGIEARAVKTYSKVSDWRGRTSS